jgi:hypothetical protein
LSEQPWRNPRPAPQLDEMRRRVRPPAYLTSFFNSWWPGLLWAGLIFWMSTDTFSSQHTGAVFYAISHWLVPSLTLEQFEPIHHIIRKTAHFTE